MGTIYYVGCRDCKVVRDLDKFCTMRKVEDRPDAIKYADEIKKDSFRAGLLVSFLWEHEGHNCVAFSEHSEPDDLNTMDGSAKNDREFWKV